MALSLDVSFPYTNPIRLHVYQVEVDFTETLPHDDIMYLREDYQRGQYSVEDLYPVFNLNETLTLQYSLSTSPGSYDNVTIRNMETNETFEGLTTLIYSGSLRVFNAGYELINEGLYRYEIDLGIEEYSLVSDIFKVVDWSDTKDLVSFNFYDTENRYGGYYFGSVSSQLWNPTAYYTGFTKVGQPEDSQSVFDSEIGNPVVTQSEPRRIRILTLTDIPDKYTDVIYQQTICDHFYVNGLRYAVSDFSIEETANSDVFDITMKLTLKDNDYNSILQ